MDIFVSGVGTGGTITGAGPLSAGTEARASGSSRSSRPRARCSPAASPRLTSSRASAPGSSPAILDTKIYDEVIRVTNDDAIATARRLAREEAIFAGISSGSITWAALQVAGRRENAGKLIVSIICDFGERYLSHPVYTELPDPDISDLEEALAAPDGSGIATPSSCIHLHPPRTRHEHL